MDFCNCQIQDDRLSTEKKSGDRVFATDNLEFFASPEPIEEEPEKARGSFKKIGRGRFRRNDKNKITHPISN
ncbi:hypothetical protein LEP1GSC029_4881 [Leptospira interrogans str. 2002000626]|uniref:Uncharacterized protein n=1 Tax=Leptospira interrogans str. 2002000626 TaxID=996803 RepID=A0A829D2Z1_LEPIR|nr:hypothetical protein LEP1GSC029_4881 [Leptospira interrogans str. 2002000626]